MTEKEIKDISQSVKDAFGQDVRELYQSIRTPTQMGKPFVSWDMLYGKIESILDPVKYLVHFVKRGAWTILLVCNRSSKTIYTFMKEKRLKEITTFKGKKGKHHYLETLVQLNSSFQSKVHQQSLGCSNASLDETTELYDCLSLLLPDNTYLAGHHVIFSIPERMYELISLRAVLLDPNLEEVDSLDLGDYNAPSYEPLASEEPLSVARKASPLVKLSKAAHDRKKQKIEISLAHKKEEKKE